MVSTRWASPSSRAEGVTIARWRSELPAPLNRQSHVVLAHEIERRLGRRARSSSGARGDGGEARTESTLAKKRVDPRRERIEAGACGI